MTARVGRGRIASHVRATDRLRAVTTRSRSSWPASVGASLVLLAVAVAILAEAEGFGSRTGPVAAVSSVAPGSIAAQAASPSTWPTSSAGSSAAASVVAVPAPSPSPSPSPAPVGPFAMDLYRPGQFATERRPIWCVAAAMLTSINIMARTTGSSVAAEQRLYTLARSLSDPRLRGDGAEPEGWALGLERLGYGRYAVLAFKTRSAAIQAAATAIRRTGRPAGLMVWYGAHSWVMSGFKASADPAATSTFTVTSVFIEDVWYPRISSIWGVSRPPDALVPVSKLPRDFLPWKRPTGRYPEKDGKFVVVLPVPA